MKKLGNSVFLLTACALLALAGCSDSSSSHSAPTVSGIASSGAAVSGTVTLKDTTGEELGPQDIGADGSFSFDVSGLTPPFVVKATDGTDTWYSYASGAGTGNVNPLTTLVLAMAVDPDDPADAYADPSVVSDDALASALGDVQTLFANLFTGFGVGTDFDPFTGDCTVNHDGIDALLDALDITVADGSLAIIEKESGLDFIDDTPIGEIDPGQPLDDITPSLLWGTYNYCYLSFATPTGGNGSEAGAGYLTFVADGTYTAVEETSSSGETGEEIGGYNNVYQEKFDLDSGEEVFLTPDREIAVVLDRDAGDGNEVGITVLCKRDTSLTAADISGDYLVMELGRETVDGTAYAESGIVDLITFNGSGGYTGEEGSGTYTVDASTGWITVDGGTLQGMVAKDGDVIVVPEIDSGGTEVGISVLVKASPDPDWGVSSLNGGYWMSELYSAPEVTTASGDDAVYSVRAALTMEEGSICGVFLDSTSGNDSLGPIPYITSSSHPAVPIALDYFMITEEENVYEFLGVVSPDGEFFVMTNVVDTPEEAGISLGVKGVLPPE